MKCIEQKSWDVRIMWCFKSRDRVSLSHRSHAMLLEKVEDSWILWAVIGRVHVCMGWYCLIKVMRDVFSEQGSH